MQPLVSIIIPVYNAEKFVRQALQSTLNQTYNNIEIIVINDGSTDRSPEIISEFSDPRIRVIHQRNKGGSVARNNGIEIAKGEYIKFLDADDELLAQAIEKQVEFSKDLGQNEIVFGDYNFIEEDGKIIHRNIFNHHKLLDSDSVRFFLTNWYVLISCPLHKRKLLNEWGQFDIHLSSGQETDLHSTLAIKGVSFIYQSQIVFNYRSHANKTRISIVRKFGHKIAWQDIYRLEKCLQLFSEHKQHITSKTLDELAANCMNYAQIYFQINNAIVGKYFLSNAKRLAKYKLPRFRRSRLKGLLIIYLGKFCGYRNIINVFNQFNKIKRTKVKTDDLSYVYLK